MGELIRLQKILAQSGVASRRASEELIKSGRVKVDGRVVREMGIQIDPKKHQVEVDGESITFQTTNLYIAFHKPRGVLSTISDPEGRPCIGDYLKERKVRLFHVGRLDKESEGLILLTNDGDWANQIAHPSSGCSKRYRVWVKEAVTSNALAKLRSGVELADGIARGSSVTAAPGGFEIEIHEGRNQIVRRMAEAVGLSVLRLQRVSIGKLALGELPVGKLRNLSSAEVISLQNH